jgi:hypothetical protein
MQLSEIKKIVQNLDAVIFQLPNKSFVPEHFHVTEVGVITKNFIDCGGTVREEKVVNFQLWEAGDYDHRLAPSKLLNIITLSEKVLSIDDSLEIEVEYQSETIGKFGLSYNGIYFQLTNKQTACLAEDACGIPPQKQKIKLSEITSSGGDSNACCTPGSSCC